MNIYEKLSLIQNELKAPKNQFNSFGKYNYRSCEDIIEASKPICLKYKAVLIISDTIKNVGERNYVEAEAILVDLEKTEDRIIVTASAREEETKKGMDGSQITGASSSYARKYALNGLFSIDDTKDSDGTNEHGKGKNEENKTTTKTKPFDKEKAIAMIVNLIGDDSELLEKQMAYHKINSLNEGTEHNLKAIYKYLTSYNK